MNEHPLRPNALLSAEAIEGLRSHWIESVEQLLGATASPAARSAVAEWAGLDLPVLTRLLASLRAELGPADDPEALSRPTAGGALGLVVPDTEASDDPILPPSPPPPQPRPRHPDRSGGAPLP